LYLVRHGEKVLKECFQFYSMSVIAEEYVEKKLLYRPWVLREHFDLLKRISPYSMIILIGAPMI
jgi:hypothetical protein